jgi:hypothetical protein
MSRINGFNSTKVEKHPEKNWLRERFQTPNSNEQGEYSFNPDEKSF